MMRLCHTSGGNNMTRDLTNEPCQSYSNHTQHGTTGIYCLLDSMFDPFFLHVMVCGVAGEPLSVCFGVGV